MAIITITCVVFVGSLENYKMSDGIMSKFEKSFIHIVEAFPCNTSAAYFMGVIFWMPKN